MKKILHCLEMPHSTYIGGVAAMINSYMANAGLFEKNDYEEEIFDYENSFVNKIKISPLRMCLYGIFQSASLKNYIKKEEHGSAKWGNIKKINKKYMQIPITYNKILTQNVSIGLDGRVHRRNLNVLLCGGSGAGKTRFYCKPNIMQCNTSFVCLDPKG